MEDAGAQRAFYAGRVDRVGHLLAGRGLDVLIVAVALAAAAGSATRAPGSRPEGFLLVLETVAVAGLVLALLLRRAAPFLAPAGTWLASAGLSFLDGELIVHQPAASIAGFVAAVLLGNQASARRSWAGLGIVALSAAVVVFNDPTHSLAELVLVPVLFSVGWLVGFALHEGGQEAEAARLRADRAERDRQLAARVAVAEERARIARELHDVVAHAVSVMVLQVGAVRHHMREEDVEDREALQNVEQAGRTALGEMRRLLDALRSDDDATERSPQPGLADLGRLVEQARRSGLEVDMQVQGTPTTLPATLDLSAYRIVQEALTNTIKHARANRVEITLVYGKDELSIEVRDDGRGLAASDGHGHGLVGMGERVHIFGGTLVAGAGARGGYALRATLPYAGVADDD